MCRTSQHSMVPRALHQQHRLYPQEEDDVMREEEAQPVHLLDPEQTPGCTCCCRCIHWMQTTCYYRVTEIGDA